MSNELSRDDLILANDLSRDILELGSRASLDRSPKKNWVERTEESGGGGLPPYIREIAREIEKTGKTLSQAIAIAISRVKKWAVSGSPEVKAKAIKALAEWEALKAKNKSRKSKKTVKATALQRVIDEAAVLNLSHVVDHDFFYIRDTKIYQEPTTTYLSRLTSRGRERIKKSNFAIPETEKYPIHDEEHARAALQRVAQHGTSEEKRRVRAAVHKKYPNMDISGYEEDDKDKKSKDKKSKKDTKD